MGEVITRGRGDAALQESEERYRFLFEQMRDGFAVHEIVCDEAGIPVDYRFVEVNPAFERLTGLAAKAIVGNTALEVMPSIERSWIERYGKVALTGQSVYFESYSGELKRHFEVTAFQPKPGQFACIFKDITARKALEGQYLHAQKMEAVGRLAGGVAHDLNNLLTPILGYTDMLLEDVPVGDVLNHPLTEVRKAGLRAKDLVRQLLAFSRKQNLELAAIDLNTVVYGFRKLLRRTLREDVRLVIELAPKTPIIRADVGQIEQVLMNLAINAQDAMPQGGELRISVAIVSCQGPGCAICGQQSFGVHAVLTLADSGCGMDEETLARAFEPFFTTKGEGHGTGLGLSMVHGIIEQHSGQILAHSEVGRGTKVTITLPVASLEPRVIQVTEAPAMAARAAGEVVMIVEDEEMVRELAIGILSRQGYTVLSAADGLECLELLERYDGPLELLLTDVIMPELNGRALFGRVAQRFPQARVLFMSGYSHEIISHQGVLDEGVDFIAKPFTVRGLTEKIREILARPAAL